MHAEGGPASMKRSVAVTGPLGWFGRLPSGGMIFGSDNTPVHPANMDSTRASRFITRTRCAKICETWGATPMRLTHEWTGVTCNTPDKYPVVGSLDGHRLFMLGGFAGAGSACSFIAGETIVKLMLDHADAAVHHPREFFSPFRFTGAERYGNAPAPSA
jgi:glycine/D-amino acid oxidase-like deaminating enzyme